ncbi:MULTISPECIES: DUF4257 domain-containing protein [Oceanobacillus]|uniref:DUF4257 domain-containing protein n=1 Tax=Oceanobacillus kimchii TaxID=746691 RepID=A0ABQ5TRG7_9BACI|nr:DUF4257 domain-containing protein [Oceanobacillus kimchii]GLO68359.1 hypothetical protein MACH08_41430 [Oceanobacillus kimchii]
MFNLIWISAAVGGITGIISHLIRNGRILVFPKLRKRPRGIYLGFIADILIGAVAAIFATTYLVPNPEDLKAVIGISILAGMSAESILLTKEMKQSEEKGKALTRINERLLK